ncbi:MAG: UDP-N-acetylmuramoyl-tripeptide--D-alanyl-D-alanine ligase, partial [Alicyclobacillus sp.]|nr:UDP-N-acetylmuramoyl-tripeptide--D-alanyl-D-alanine ligase [Alicyclobacillus sp.]
NGKTTTKEMLAAVFRAMGTCLYTEANLNTELGLPLTILRRTPQHRSMVLEMGMRGLGQIRELCDVAEPTAGIITNIGQSHLELLGSEANIASAKAELLEALPETGIAALNGDDPWLRQVAERCKGRVLWYGSDAQSDAWASDIVVTDEGTDFVSHVLGNSVNVHIPTFGIHNVHNALGALLLGAAHGIALPAAAAGLTTVPSTSGRLNIVQGSNDRVVLDDCYNASPLSVKASLRVLLDLARGRNTVAILGDMYELGSYAEAGHREVGTFAAEAGVDRLIAVGEFARWIAEAAKAAHCPYVRHYPDKDTAMRHLDTDVPHSAMVLVKASRGAALEDIVAKLVPEGR